MSEPSASGTAVAADPTPAPAAGDAQAEKPGKKQDLQSPTVADKPKGSLPGVVTRGPENEFDADVLDQMFGDADKGGDGDKKVRLRDPETGKFLKQDAKAEPAEQTPDKPALPPGSEPEPPKPKFKFGGKDWESQDQAEQNFRSLQGQFRPMQDKIRELEGDRDYGYQAVEAWKRHAEGLRAEVDQLKAGGAKPTPAGSAGQQIADVTSEADVLKNIDLDAYNYIATKGGLAKGAEYLVGEIMRVVKDNVLPQAISGLRQELTNQMLPMRQDAEHRETVAAMERAHTQLVSLRTPDGRVAFPELQVADKVERIAELWVRESRDEADEARRIAALRTPQGLMSAIALYRLIDSIESAPVPATTPASTPAALQPEGAAGITASVDARGDEGFRPSGPRSDMSAGMAALVAELSKPEMIDHQLGFARNRR